MLFFKECKKVLFSLTFIIYFFATLGMYFSQFHNDSGIALEKPMEGENDYGMVAKEVPEILMPAAVNSLVSEYLSEEFTAYPYGFYKEVKLKEKKRVRMAEIIEELSGISVEELNSFEDFEEGGYIMGEDGTFVYVEPRIPEIHIPETMTYEYFKELMKEADQIIGGGSKYSDQFLVGNFSLVPKTYEDALAEYESFLHEDKITKAYGRLYCDYMGIDLAILPVFCAAALAGLDKKSGMEQLAFSRKISSAKLIFTRYFALVTVMLIPLVMTTVIAYFKVVKLYPGSELDNFAIFQYGAFWLIPNIMTAAAVGMLITEMLSGLIAIFVQGAWWFSSIFAGASGLTGNIQKFTLVMRHNSLMKADVFAAEWGNFVFNRVFYIMASLILIAFTAVIYELKRKGIFNEFLNIRKNNKSKSKK